MSNVNTAVNAIRNMNNDELSQVIDAIKMRRSFIARDTVRSLVKGDVVEFTGRRGTIRGTVEKVNIKKVKVREANSFTVWNVPASMLTVIKDTVEM